MTTRTMVGHLTLALLYGLVSAGADRMEREHPSRPTAEDEEITANRQRLGERLTAMLSTLPKLCGAYAGLLTFAEVEAAAESDEERAVVAWVVGGPAEDGAVPTATEPN
jgi:hypothetical protein